MCRVWPRTWRPPFTLTTPRQHTLCAPAGGRARKRTPSSRERKGVSGSMKVPGVTPPAHPGLVFQAHPQDGEYRSLQLCPPGPGWPLMWERALWAEVTQSSGTRPGQGDQGSPELPAPPIPSSRWHPGSHGSMYVKCLACGGCPPDTTSSSAPCLAWAMEESTTQEKNTQLPPKGWSTGTWGCWAGHQLPMACHSKHPAKRQAARWGGTSRRGRGK